MFIIALVVMIGNVHGRANVVVTGSHRAIGQGFVPHIKIRNPSEMLYLAVASWGPR